MAKKKRKPRPKSPNPVGRPGTVTPEVVAKLEYAYLMDANDAEACFFAGITKDALSRHFIKHPEFREKATLLKANLKFRSKVLVGKEILEHKNVEDAKWLLERRSREEYGTRVEQKVEANHRHSIESMPDEDLDAIIAEHL
jgi:hypothetical protein